jgi:hypothetical protein
VAAFGLLAAAFLAGAGCGPADPLEIKVSAESPIAFSMWESRIRDRLTQGQASGFDEAVQEFKFHIMAQATATGSDAIDAEMRQEIDGRTIRYVLQWGLGWELSRLVAERAEIESAMTGNARLRTRPGDTASEDYLREFRRKQEAHLQSVDDQIKLVRGKLAAAAPIP